MTKLEDRGGKSEFDKPAPAGIVSVLLFCGKFKGYVERAERNRAGQDKDNGEDAEDYGCSAGEYLGADQQSDDDGCRQADDAIDASHIFRHDKPPIKYCCFII